MVLFTLGTGIGGGIILGDRVIEGEHSHGGELGHIKIELRNGRLCGCGHRGCLEAYASATAVVARTHEALNADGGKSALHALLREQGELTARDVFRAADAGDELAARIVDETAYYLAVGAANAMHTVDPDMRLLRRRHDGGRRAVPGKDSATMSARSRSRCRRRSARSATPSSAATPASSAPPAAAGSCGRRGRRGRIRNAEGTDQCRRGTSTMTMSNAPSPKTGGR